MKKRASRVIFLDANVVMYAAGATHPLREPCQRALERAVEQEVPLVTSAEVLQEIFHRYFSIGRADAARKVYEATVRLCRRVLPVFEQDTSRALELLESRQRLNARDALHAATMEAHGLNRILSTDRHFDLVETIERVDPETFGLDRG